MWGVWMPRFPRRIQSNYTLTDSITQTILLSPFIHFSHFLNSQPEEEDQREIKMALQVQASLHTTRLSPSATPTLRPLSNPSTLKSSFFSRSLNLLLHPNQLQVAYGPPRFTMRVASKQAYICRDCGLFSSLDHSLFSIYE